jgi:hypothetical protein
MGNIKSIIFLIVILVYLVPLVGCNQNTKDSSKKIGKDTAEGHFVNIEGLLAFTKKTTLKNATDFFEKNKINYTTNPDFSMPELFGHNNFSASFGSIGCPYRQLIYLPHWELLGLSFKDILFGFYNDTLCFIDISEEGVIEIISEGNIFKLRRYYQEKYGKAEYENSSKLGDRSDYSPEFEWWRYSNEKDSVFVQFNRWHEDFKKNKPYHNCLDEYIISFPNSVRLDEVCEQYRKDKRRKDQQLEEQQKKIILDSL